MPIGSRSMTTLNLKPATNAASRPDPAAGAAYARGRIESAAKTIASEAYQHPHNRSLAATGAAKDSTTRWYHALRRHDPSTVDDHARMDELSITAAGAAGAAEPPKAKHA